MSIFTTTDQWSEAISEYEAELGLHEALEDTIQAAVACRNLGECYCGLQQFDKALSLQQRHLTLARFVLFFLSLRSRFRLFYPFDSVRIHHECEDGIEKPIPRITDWHHETMFARDGFFYPILT